MTSKNHIIAIDCIPLLSGSTQGGAKLMVLSLLERLPSLLSDVEITLLTAKHNHDELAYLERENLHRICVLPNAQSPFFSEGTHKTSIKTWVHQTLFEFFPSNLIRQLKYSLRRPPPILIQSRFALYFCPFTVPYFYFPGVPLVSLIYDLQFISYPEFFTPMEVFYRRQQFEDAWNLSTHLITISEYVRQTVLQNAFIRPEQVSAIPIGLVHRFPSINMNTKDELFRRFGLEHERFLLYPANFWLHKNHIRLIDAFNLYLQRHPTSKLALVFPGDLDTGRRRIQAHVNEMGLANRIILPGFLTTAELGALYASAKALIFPSLYEGFGMPLLEAMAASLPILCSNITSLPEVVGDAALLFDPRQPSSIVEAIERLENDPSLQKVLIRKGKERLHHFGNRNRMTNAYARLFQNIIDPV